MAAPDFSVLYDFETAFESAVATAIEGVLADAGINLTVNQSRSSEIQETPGVDVYLSIGSPLAQRTTEGQADPKHITPVAYNATLLVRIFTTRPISQDNADLHGPIRGWVRYALSAEGKKIAPELTPYWQFMDMLPAASSPLLLDDKQQDITELNYTLIFAIRNGAWPSEIQEQVETPTFSPDGGSFEGETDVTIASATSGTTIRYTIDGSTPTKLHGTVYTVPVELTESVTLKAIAYKTGMSDSAIKSASYSIVIATSVLHILVTGQSNAIGGASLPIFTTEQIIGGKMFNGGMKPGSIPGDIASFIPLQEQNNGLVGGETGMSAMVRWLVANAPSNYLYLISNAGVGGAPYEDLKKGTQPYSDHMAQISAGMAVASDMGLTYRVLCVVAMHGETDEQNSVPDYRGHALEWQGDYETDAQALTGQSEAIPMFQVQQGAYGPNQYNAADLDVSSAIGLFLANADQPGKVVLVSPETYLDFYSHPHFSAFSHAWLGEQFARAIKTICFDSSSFRSIYPTAANIVGDTIVVDFSVPVPPIRLDYRFNCYTDSAGFSFISSVGTLIPTAVTVSGPSQLTLHFGETPGGTGKRVGYALASSVTKTVRGSNIADSNDAGATEGLIGVPLSNFMPTLYFDF